MLYYIYCDASPEAHLALPLLRFAHQYQIKDLLDVCQCVVANNLAIPDWCHVARTYCVLSGYESLHTPPVVRSKGARDTENDDADADVKMADDSADANEDPNDLHSLHGARSMSPETSRAAANNTRARTERSRARSRSLSGMYNRVIVDSYGRNASPSPTGHPTPDCRDLENRCAALNDPSFVSLNRLLYSLREFFRCNMDAILGESQCGGGSGVDGDDGIDSEIDWIKFLSKFPRFATSCLRVALASSLRGRNKNPWQKNTRSLYSISSHTHSHSLRHWDESQRVFPSKHRQNFRTGPCGSSSHSGHAQPLLHVGGALNTSNVTGAHDRGDHRSSTRNHDGTHHSSTRNRKLHHYHNRKSLSRTAQPTNSHSSSSSTFPWNIPYYHFGKKHPSSAASSSASHKHRTTSSTLPPPPVAVGSSSSMASRTLPAVATSSSSTPRPVAETVGGFGASDSVNGKDAMAAMPSSSSKRSRNSRRSSASHSQSKSTSLSHNKSSTSRSSRKVSDSDVADTSSNDALRASSPPPNHSSSPSHASHFCLPSSSSSSSSFVPGNESHDSAFSEHDVKSQDVSNTSVFGGTEASQNALLSDTDDPAVNVGAATMTDDDATLSSSSTSSSSKTPARSGMSSSRRSLPRTSSSSKQSSGALGRSNSMTTLSENALARHRGTQSVTGVVHSRQRSLSGDDGATCGKKRKR